MKKINKIRKFLKLSSGKKYIVIESSFFLTISVLMLKLWGIKRTQNLLLKIPLAETKKPFNVSQVNNIIPLIKTVSNIIPFKTKCIEEAITLWIMLRKRGLESHLKIGINENTENFKAHAWLETNGIVFDISEDMEQSYSDFAYNFFSRTDKK